MADFLTPQFQMPFEVRGKDVVCVEQDSEEDVVQNAITALRWPKGTRVGMPEYGLADQTFRQGGPDVLALARTVEQWEPDADIDVLDKAINQMGEAEVTVEVSADRRDSPNG